MILGVGTDIVEINRITTAKPAFFHKCFTAAEICRCETTANPAVHFAGYFAAKESVAKAVGTGFRGFSPRDVEICHDNLGKPFASLNKTAVLPCDAHINISISHGRDYAVAFAIISIK